MTNQNNTSSLLSSGRHHEINGFLNDERCQDFWARTPNTPTPETSGGERGITRRRLQVLVQIRTANPKKQTDLKFPSHDGRGYIVRDGVLATLRSFSRLRSARSELESLLMWLHHDILRDYSLTKTFFPEFCAEMMLTPEGDAILQAVAGLGCTRFAAYDALQVAMQADDPEGVVLALILYHGGSDQRELLLKAALVFWTGDDSWWAHPLGDITGRLLREDRKPPSKAFLMCLHNAETLACLEAKIDRPRELKLPAPASREPPAPPAPSDRPASGSGGAT